MPKTFMRKTSIIALALACGTAAGAQEDILSRYKEQSGRNPEAAGAPPAGSSESGPGASSGKGGGPAATDGRLADGTEMTDERVEGFNEAVNRVFPMTPEMIRQYRDIYEEQQRATLERPEPEAETTTGLVSLEPGEPSPLVHVAPSIASVIGFYDASGAAWPIDQYVVGNGQDFETIRLGENSNNLTVSPNKRMGHTNIVALLDGMDKPVTIRVSVSEKTANYRHDIQVMKLGPNAEANTAVQPSARTVEEAGSSLLLAALSGVDLPPKAERVSIEGVSARGWQIDDSLFLRSRHALLSPSWTESMSGPDGVRVYRIDPASVALFSVSGKIVRAEINLP